MRSLRLWATRSSLAAPRVARRDLLPSSRRPCCGLCLCACVRVRVRVVCACARVCVCVYSQLQASTAHDYHAFACFTLHIRVLCVVVHGCMQHVCMYVCAYVCMYVCMYVPGAWRCCRLCRKPRLSFSSASAKMYACMYVCMYMYACVHV